MKKHISRLRLSKQQRFAPDVRELHKESVQRLGYVRNFLKLPFAPRRDEEMLAVRIGYNETGLRERAKRLGAIWRPNHRLREMRWLDAKHLGIADRVPPY